MARLCHHLAHETTTAGYRANVRTDFAPAPPDPVCPDRSAPEHSPHEMPPAERAVIDGVVAQVFGVGAGELKACNRGRAHVAQARQVAMYLAHVIGQLTLSQVGDLFERDRTTVAHACSLVEDRRDDPLFDRVIELLEGVVGAMLTPRPETAPLFN